MEMVHIRRQPRMLFFLMTTMLAVAVALGASTPAHAAAYQYKSVSRTSCPDSALGCTLFELKVAGEVKYNGANVYIHQGPYCTVEHSYGATTDITWCGLWNNGGADYGYMSLGVNYTINAIVKGFPVAKSYYVRIDITRTGIVSYRGCYRNCDG